MRLHCLGINHHTAQVCTREKLALDANQTSEYWQLVLERTCQQVRELIVLSTCNRVEIYAVASQPVFPQLEQALAEHSDLPLEEIQHLFYRYVDEQVISHLMRVSSGLDSMVLGEPQILGQVTQAYITGLENKSCGKHLSRLFQSAIHAGKRVRSETGISKNPMSVPSLAAHAAKQIVGKVSDSQITLLGAGEMAELAIKALKERGAQRFIVISRTISSACTLAQKWEGHAGTMDNLAGALEETDILICSTSAPHTIIHPGMIEQVMAVRRNRPLGIIGIAVPRDVAPEVGAIAGVSLLDIDSLNHHVEQALESRVGEIPKVEKIIDEEYQAFKAYFETLRVVPVIAGMRLQADAIRRKELEKALRQLDGIDPRQEERIKAMTHAIVQKILHEPTIRLRQEANGPNGEIYAEAVSTLFGLNGTCGNQDRNE